MQQQNPYGYYDMDKKKMKKHSYHDDDDDHHDDHYPKKKKKKKKKYYKPKKKKKKVKKVYVPIVIKKKKKKKSNCVHLFFIALFQKLSSGWAGLLIFLHPFVYRTFLSPRNTYLSAVMLPNYLDFSLHFLFTSPRILKIRL